VGRIVTVTGDPATNDLPATPAIARCRGCSRHDRGGARGRASQGTRTTRFLA
jgi:hypothetical protein